MKIRIKYLCTCGEWSSSIFDTENFGTISVEDRVFKSNNLVTHGICRACGRLPLDISVEQPNEE
jgi:hypothetical protein